MSNSSLEFHGMFRMRLPIDLFMFAVFVAAYRPFTTGLALHEWLSLALVTPVLVHAVVNWDWAEL